MGQPVQLAKALNLIAPANGIGQQLKLRQWYRGEMSPGRASPLELVMIQGTPFCNIDCRYCYLPNRSKKGHFPLDLLAPLFSKLLNSGLLGPAVSVVWHAGEPLVLPPDYYREAMDRIHRSVGQRCRATHFIQTNGTLITQEYCKLIKSSGIQVGVSIDGPAHIHDRNRVTRAGKPTHEQVMAGIRLLQQSGIVFSAIAVLTAYSLEFADEMFNFFKELGVREVGFNIDEIDGTNARSSLSDAGLEARYSSFMTRILHRTLEDKLSMSVRELTQTLNLVSASIVGRSISSSEANPFSILSCDISGNLFTFSPELLDVNRPGGGDFSIGNISTIDFGKIFEDPKFSRVYAEVQAGVALCRDSCRYFSMCGGGAPANKLGENGTFASAETMFCRYKKKITIDVVEDYLLEMLTKRRRFGRRSASERPNSTSDKRMQQVPAASIDGPEPSSSRPVGSSELRQLIPGVPILFDGDAGARITLSTGITLFSAACDAECYHPASRIPRSPWRTPTPAELMLLRTSGLDSSVSSFVAVVKPPANIIAPLMALGCERAKVQGQESGAIDAARSEIAATVCANLSRLYGTPDRETRPLGVAINPPGHCTITVDGLTNRRIGLHVDSWSKLPPDKRAEAPNRLCLNLGRNTRQLLFVNLAFDTVVNRLLPASLDLRSNGATDLARIFMANNPMYPVVAVKIAPGEGYIAPTENLIHDGSSEGMTHSDVCITILGYFRRPDA